MKMRDYNYHLTKTEEKKINKRREEAKRKLKNFISSHNKELTEFYFSIIHYPTHYIEEEDFKD